MIDKAEGSLLRDGGDGGDRKGDFGAASGDREQGLCSGDYGEGDAVRGQRREACLGIPLMRRRMSLSFTGAAMSGLGLRVPLSKRSCQITRRRDGPRILFLYPTRPFYWV